MGRGAERGVPGRGKSGRFRRRRNGRRKSVRGGEEEKRVRAVGEYPRAANVARVLVSRIFVRAGAVRTRRGESRRRERHARTTPSRERGRERKNLREHRRRVSLVSRRDGRERVSNSRGDLQSADDGIVDIVVGKRRRRRRQREEERTTNCRGIRGLLSAPDETKRKQENGLDRRDFR